MPRSKWHHLGSQTYALSSGSNIGFIVQGNSALMVDAGLDADNARKGIQQLETVDATVAALLLTHGHADHFGGAAWVAAQCEVPIYAPPLEGTIAAHPLLEPLFLYGGADPIEELRDKFTLARHPTGPSRPLTDGAMRLAEFDIQVVPLPGHAPAQVGIGYRPRDDGAATLYCGDSVFPLETLQRHPILFCADMDAWLATLKRLPGLPYAHFVAGHGEPVTDIAPLAKATAARLQEIRDHVLAALDEPREPYAVLRAVADRYRLIFSAPQFFLLSLTTIHAALTSLQRAKEAAIFMDDNHLLWRRCT